MNSIVYLPLAIWVLPLGRLESGRLGWPGTSGRTSVVGAVKAFRRGKLERSDSDRRLVRIRREAPLPGAVLDPPHVVEVVTAQVWRRFAVGSGWGGDSATILLVRRYGSSMCTLPSTHFCWHSCWQDR